MISKLRIPDRVRRTVTLGLLVLLLGHCGETFKEAEFRDMSVEFTNPRGGVVDATLALNSAQSEVSRQLPGTYVNAFAFTGRCDELLSGRGRFHFMLIRPERRIFRDSVYGAFVAVDTSVEQMNIQFRDYSDLDFNTDGLSFASDELSFETVSRIAHDHISTLALPGCDITISRIGASWNVRCGAIESAVQECLFEINPLTGEITPLE